MKQIYNIYHAIGPEKFTESQDQIRIYVGHVEANSLNQAYALTQNHEWPWNVNAPCRSTSVGDVIECDGKFYMVAGIGFIEVGTEEPADEDIQYYADWECGEGTLHPHDQECDCIRYIPEPEEYGITQE